MEFNKMYQKVKYIVRKCEKEYYIQLWEKDDWEQEGQLTLFELYQKILKLKQMKNYFINTLKRNLEIILKIK
ncbi:Competence-specific sigma factor ComX [Streptococcus sp. ZB199]|nr:Competence-specific sigma factor ComX [Streptococcus sp. ZB199]